MTIFNNLSNYTGVLNAKDYGAKGDDTSDNTQNFIDLFNDAYSQRKVVSIPRGVYKIDGTVDAKSPFFGVSGYMDRNSRTSSEWNTIIKNTSINDGSAMFRMDAPSNPSLNPGWWCKDIKFDGNHLNTIALQGRDDAWSENNPLHNYYLYRICVEHAYIGMDFYGFLGFFTDCYARNCSQIGLRMTRNNAGKVTGGEYAGLTSGQIDYGNTPLPWSMIIVASGPYDESPLHERGAPWTGKSDKGAGVITLHGTTIEAASMNNGLLISEGFNTVLMENVYMEGYEGDATTEAYILSIGAVNRWNDGPAIGTPDHATANVILDNVKYGNGAGQFESGIGGLLGGKVLFDNIINLDMRNVTDTANEVVFTERCRFSSKDYIGGNLRWNYSSTSKHWGDQMNVVDKSLTPGNGPINYISNPNFKGGVRGYSDLILQSTLTVSEETTITRDGSSSLKLTAPSGASNTAQMLLYPLGQSELSKGGIILWKIWFYVPNLTEYTNDIAYPRFYIKYDTPSPVTTEQSVFIPWSGFAGKAFTIGEWNLAHSFAEVPAGSTNINLAIQPAYDSTLSEDYYIYLSDFAMVRHPGILHRFWKGDYKLDSSVGHFVGNAFHVQGSAIPSNSSIQWLKGDIVWNDSPDIGESVGWVCTSSGPGGTAVFSPFGDITT